MKALSGVVPPAVTVFNEDESLNESLFREHLRWLLSFRVGGISIGGSTGEGYALSADELHRVIRIGVEEAAGNVPVVAGVIRDSTRDAVMMSEVAASAGADYLMVTPTHYFRPDCDAHYAFFKSISDAVDLPILIYNVIPTAIITPECMARLATIDHVVGIKQSGGDIHALNKMMLALPKEQLVFTAIDALLYPSYAIGAVGAIGLTNTVLPDLCVEQWEAFRNGDHEKARDLHFKISHTYWAIDKFNKPARTKEYLRQRGCNVGVPRSPFHPLSDEDREGIRAAVAFAGVGRLD